jgi:hypothetical protein
MKTVQVSPPTQDNGIHLTPQGVISLVIVLGSLVAAVLALAS